MSHGLPDFYRGVDIAYQALAQMIVRPMYGAAQKVYFDKTVTANAETTLATITGKGIIYGCILHLDYTSTQKWGRLRLHVDGQLISSQTFETLNKYGFNKAQSCAVFLTFYDEVNFIYAIALGYSITFETTVVISYAELNGGTPMVQGEIYYALI